VYYIRQIVKLLHTASFSFSLFNVLHQMIDLGPMSGGGQPLIAALPPHHPTCAMSDILFLVVFWMNRLSPSDYPLFYHPIIPSSTIRLSPLLPSDYPLFYHLIIPLLSSDYPSSIIRLSLLCYPIISCR
jgi:hypothetical protein